MTSQSRADSPPEVPYYVVSQLLILEWSELERHPYPFRGGTPCARRDRKSDPPVLAGCPIKKIRRVARLAVGPDV